MHTDDVAAILHAALLLSLQLGGPPLGAALVVGLMISLLQAVTQINEATLVFVPKIAAVFGIIVVMGGFMYGALSHFTHLIFDQIIQVGGM
jgi:flagellar biosynthetic protein FliQ